MQIRFPDNYWVYGENGKRILTSDGNADGVGVSVKLYFERDSLIPAVTADEIPLCYVVLKWFFRDGERRAEPIRILGDAWERAYGDLSWQGIVPERCMPWYCMVSNGTDSNPCYAGRHTECFGVKVRPSSFAFWQYDDGGVTLTLDIRCGGRGVILGGRTLRAAEILFRDYRDCSAYQSGKRFCGELCDDPIVPREPVYGFNNFYYAYGVSSAVEVLRDAAKLADCTKGLRKPYMVIDDCWQPNPCDGPWDRGNEKFPDMKGLAEQMTEMGVNPGIWIRPLSQMALIDLPQVCRLERNGCFLDPSDDGTLDYIKTQFSRLVGWGYRLIKFDFVTYDLFGKWGWDCPGFLADGNWSFHDRSKTSAEIILRLYRAIREASGDAVLIGCNAIGHLCAGLVEINRTGDDTSGRDWRRTRQFGVNTLAFRSIQNGFFYTSDADCVGLTGLVPWELNQRWMHLLAHSGTPLFISWDPSQDTEEVRAAVCGALRVNSRQEDRLIPLDWMENNCPRRWSLNGEEFTVDWFGHYAYDQIEKR